MRLSYVYILYKSDKSGVGNTQLYVGVPMSSKNTLQKIWIFVLEILIIVKSIILLNWIELTEWT